MPKKDPLSESDEQLVVQSLIRENKRILFNLCLIRWKGICERAEEVDPNDEFIWRGVAIGFLIGCGFTIEEAIELEKKIPL